MFSVKNLTIDMLNLSSEDQKIIKKLSLDRVVLEVRQGVFPTYEDITAISPLKYCYDSETKEALDTLDKVMWDELLRLDMIRPNSDLECLRISANIIALIQMVEERFKRWTRYYFYSDRYILRLIQRLDNETYETWRGFDAKTVEKFLNLLEVSLTKMGYEMAVLRFGLKDGVCVDREMLMEYFGWQSDTSVRYQEKKISKTLYPILDDLKALAKLPCSPPRV